MAVCVYMCTHNKFCVKYVYKIFPPDFLIKVYNREESFSKKEIEKVIPPMKINT